MQPRGGDLLQGGFPTVPNSPPGAECAAVNLLALEVRSRIWLVLGADLDAPPPNSLLALDWGKRA
jgi:hypothetical protein